MTRGVAYHGTDPRGVTHASCPTSLVRVLTATAALAALALGPVLAQAAEDPAPSGRDGRRVELESWPQAQGRQLEKLVAKFADRGRYAVYDADNTICRYDLEESLLPYLEMRGVLRRDTIDPSLKLLPFRDGESLYSYYVRLCEIDDKVCYPWIAQVFSGLSLGQLKTHVDELFAHGKPIPVAYYWFMLFDTDVRAGGLRLWVNRKQKYTDALEAEQAERVAEQKAAGVYVDADRNWVVVEPAEIGG